MTHSPRMMFRGNFGANAKTDGQQYVPSKSKSVLPSRPAAQSSTDQERAEAGTSS